MSSASRRAGLAGGALALLLVAAGCTVGGEPSAQPTSEGSSSPTQPEPTDLTTSEPSEEPTEAPPPPPPPTTSATPTEPGPDVQAELERLLDEGGLGEGDVGYPRLPPPEGTSDFGLETPTQDQCDPPDETDALRVARVQHWYQPEAGTPASEVIAAVSTELVVYEPGGADEAIAAILAVPSECPEVTNDDGTVRTYGGADPPATTLLGSVALAGGVVDASGVEADVALVAQPLGSMVGYVYVVGLGDAVYVEAERLAATMAERMTALEPAVEPGLPG